MEVEKVSHSRRRPSRELGLIEKNKVKLLALEQLGYRAVKNRANVMTPQGQTVQFIVTTANHEDYYRKLKETM
jgi:hypothetical protein